MILLNWIMSCISTYKVNRLLKSIRKLSEDDQDIIKDYLRNRIKEDERRTNHD